MFPPKPFDAVQGDIAQKNQQIKTNLLSYVPKLSQAVRGNHNRKTDKKSEKFMNIQEYSKKIEMILILLMRITDK